MNRTDFLDTLRRRLAGMPQDEIDEAVADYTSHFAEGVADGRTEAEIAAALGDPMRLARELRAEAGFRRWEAKRTPGNLFAVLFGFLALLAVDFVFLLPVLGMLILFTLIAGIVALGLCLAGFGLVLSLFDQDTTMTALTRILGGISMLGFGIGGGALLLLMVDWLVRVLGKFARLHYTLLGQADLANG